MIQIENLHKTFILKGKEVKAVDDVTLDIGDGEIYGVIGYSGAGKSTLVRCINFLEVPDSGSIEISGFGKVISKNGSLFLEKDGREVPMSDKDLRALRRQIGMIFQHFNLLDRNTVFDNIAYPLKYTGMPKDEIAKKVDKLLELVELSDKRDAYPAQLSGGQKQRVAIARALANDPKVLLSDESTSALDPDATQAILKLLKDLNKKLGLTIVIITHEMSVIKSIAHKVAVMEDGKVVEQGNVYDIFAEPKQRITKRFTSSTTAQGNIQKLIKEGAVNFADTDSEKLVKLTFTKAAVGEAIISHVSRLYDVNVNIQLADVDIIAGDLLGGIIAVFSGEPTKVSDALKYLNEYGVKTEVIHHE